MYISQWSVSNKLIKPYYKLKKYIKLYLQLGLVNIDRFLVWVHGMYLPIYGFNFKDTYICECHSITFR